MPLSKYIRKIRNLVEVSGQKLLCCNYWDFGIGKVNNQWRFRNKKQDLTSARYFEITDALEVYSVMNIKVFRLQLIMNYLRQNQLPYMSSRKKEKCQLDKI
jgi:hypothetical protein